jgi:Ca-activated chloride channel family protein
MEPDIRFDHQLLAVEAEHDVHVMLELHAPDAPSATRPPLNIALVLDRSGSMQGDKLDYAKRSAAWLVSRLLPTDRIALVDFDDDVRLLAPLHEASSGWAAAAIPHIQAGGSTNLSGGWLKGIEELRRAPTDEPRVLLLLTDGQANVGIVDGAALTSLAASARRDRIGTTTIGYGSDFDEDTLAAMADAGGGNAHYAPTADAAPAIFAEEFEGLTRLVAQNVSVEIRPERDVEVVSVLNEYPQVPVSGGVQVALGDAYAGDRRRVVLALHVPLLAELGVAKIAELVVRYVSVGDEVAEHTLTVPVAVNLVSANEAAAASPDLEVTEEVLVLTAARARDEAIRLADEGDFDAAQHVIEKTEARLRHAGLRAEADALDTQLLSADRYDPLARKQLRYESNLRRRKRS